MLSPSHPGPYKATHLAMCDRTVNFSGLKICACCLSICTCRALLHLRPTVRRLLRPSCHRMHCQVRHPRQLQFRWSVCRDAYPRMICCRPRDSVAHCKLDSDNGSCQFVVRTVFLRNVCISFVLQPGAKSSSIPTNRKYLPTPFSSYGLRGHSFGKVCANTSFCR